MTVISVVELKVCLGVGGCLQEIHRFFLLTNGYCDAAKQEAQKKCHGKHMKKSINSVYS